MSDMIANHISARVPGEEGAFLINAYGMLYEEITASSLIKVDHDGRILSTPDFGPLNYGVNQAGYVIHSAVHAARPEVDCVIHVHTWATMAVSSLEFGLLPITQTAMRFLKIGYHDYCGVVLNVAEQESLIRDLGGGEAVPGERRPRAVVAVACERDMVSGLHDVAGKIPVLGLTMTLPSGPCKDASLDLEQLERWVRAYVV